MPYDYKKLKDQYDKMQARKPGGITTPPTSGVASITSTLDQQTKPSGLGSVLDQANANSKHPTGTMAFLGSMAKGAISPFVKLGVTGLSAIESTGKLLGGDKAGADKALEGYDVPGFGHVTPAKIGTDVQDQVKGEGAFGKETLKTIGTGAEIASTLAGGEGASGLIKEAGKGTIKNLAIQGAKEGAMVGAAGGFGSGAQEEDATAGSVISSTLKGAAVGSALGAATGAISPYLSKEGRTAIANSKIKEAESEAVDIVSPKLTNKVKEEALSEGRVSSEGLLGKQVVKPSKTDLEVAKSVEGIVSKKAQPVENINAIKSGIKDVAESHVSPILEANPRPYNLNTFKARIDELKMPTLFKSDPTMERTYRLVQERAAEIANEFPKTKLGAWKARQAFDQAVEREFPRVFDGSVQDNVIKHAVNDVRGAWNDFIVEGLPENNGVKEAFKQMSRMYQAVENIAEKGAGEVGTNAIQRFTKKYPNAVKIGGTALGSGAVGGGIISALKD